MREEEKEIISISTNLIISLNGIFNSPTPPSDLGCLFQAINEMMRWYGVMRW